MARSVEIIIVNWNSGDQLRSCLASVGTARDEALDLRRIVVVDNASTDGSANGLTFPSLPLTVLRNQQNRGFARACNQGAVGSSTDYLLFLNPDTRLFTTTLSKPLAFMEQPENRRFGIVGVQLIDGEGRVARTCARFPTPSRFVSKMVGLDRALPQVFQPHFMVEWDHGVSREVDQVMGAFFLIRRSLFEALRGFDERFFVYFEEVDLTMRARHLGSFTYYLSSAQAYHRSGGTDVDGPGATRLFYSLRSRILYVYKHFNRWAATLVTLATLLVEPVSRLTVAAAKRSPTRATSIIKAYALLWRAILRGLRVTRESGTP